MRRLAVAIAIILTLASVTRGDDETDRMFEGDWIVGNAHSLAVVCASKATRDKAFCIGVVQAVCATSFYGGFKPVSGKVSIEMLLISFFKHIDDKSVYTGEANRMRPGYMVMLESWVADGYMLEPKSYGVAQ